MRVRKLNLLDSVILAVTGPICDLGDWYFDREWERWRSKVMAMLRERSSWSLDAAMIVTEDIRWQCEDGYSPEAAYLSIVRPYDQ